MTNFKYKKHSLELYFNFLTDLSILISRCTHNLPINNQFNNLFSTHNQRRCPKITQKDQAEKTARQAKEENMEQTSALHDTLPVPSD